MTPRGSRLTAKERVAQLIATQSQLDAITEIETAIAKGGTPIAEIPPRTRATVCGSLQSVTLRPKDRVPALEADLFDGSGTLLVVWLGRRSIGGVDPGRRISVTGLVTDVDGRPTMFNPNYSLSPGPGE